MKLIYLNGPHKDKPVAIAPPGISMGRESDNDIVLTDTEASRYHAKVELDHDVWYLQDLGSTNGVQLNGKKLAERSPLSVQDVIRIGSTQMMFCDDDGAEKYLAALSPAAPSGDADAPAAAGSTGTGARRRRLLILGLVLALVVLGVLVIAIPEKKPPPQAKPIPPRSLQVEYEKLDARAEAAFRYELTVQDGQMRVTVDDLRNRRHTTESKPLTDEQLETIRDFLVTPELMGLRTAEPRFPPGEYNRTRLLVQFGRDVNQVDIVNDIHPPPFAAAAEAIENFAEETFGFVAIPLTREAIIAKAREKFAFAERCYAEREVEPSNLYQAYDAYRYVVEYLAGFDDRPDIYQKAFQQQQATWTALNDQLKDAEFQARLQRRMGELEKARAIYNDILQRMPNPHNEFAERARKQLHEISRAEQQRKRNKRKR